ncbi:MAG: nucleotide exchange factor GrpE [Actinomycetes bacterium]
MTNTPDARPPADRPAAGDSAPDEPAEGGSATAGPPEGRDPNAEQTGVKFTDKRRIDPVTGQVRNPAPAPASTPDPAPADGADEALAEWAADARVQELTADLQRITAEYANYRKRVERDREAVRELSVVGVLIGLLPILDGIERAREHDELTGAFKVVGDGLESRLAGLGLESFGTVGDVFDPEIHEAMTHSEGEGLEAPICSQIFAPGYRYRGRIVRPARVAVSE